MKILMLAIGWILFFPTLPVLIELALFLFANLFLRRALERKYRQDAFTSNMDPIAILVPAHDEEKNIERCVHGILSADRGNYSREVIVIADNCHDETAIRARRAGARVIERFDESNRGKGAAIHYAISILMPEPFSAFLIVDADTVVSKNFTRAMGDRFAVGKDAVQCVNLPLNTEASPKIRLMKLALLSMNVLRPIGREILGCSVGIFGNGFGLSKKLLGKAPYTANSITEDLEYHFKLIENGFKVHFTADAQVLSDFPVSREGSETQRARWEGGRFLLQRKLLLPVTGKLFSGKLALLEPLLELMSMPLSYEVLLLCALIMIPGQPFAIYGICGLLLIFAQTVAATALYGTRKDFLAFFEIPAYLLWKIIKIPVILLNSRKNSSWVRTKRD